MDGGELNFYRGRRVLVTGYTGFKGAWLCRILADAGAQVTGYALPPPARPNLFELAELAECMTCVSGDVRDRAALERAFRAARPELVIHLAAQPIVREGYRDPAGTYETNVMGTVNLLECVRRTGGVGSVLNVTTDKVYREADGPQCFQEDLPLDGFDPYANSKSCSELVTHCYYNSFFAAAGPAVSTARAGNVIGGGDFAAGRIVPDCVRAALAGQPVAVRNPGSVRPYQHVLEPLLAYLAIVRRQWEDRRCAGWYNVGPDADGCVATGRLAELFCRAWGNGLRWECRAEPDAPREADSLRLDCARLKDALGWRPRWSVAQAVEKTVEWTRVWLGGGDIPGEMRRQLGIYLKDGGCGAQP